MLKINEECFYQGIRQTTFYHEVPMEDLRYDLNKDVVNGELVPFGGNAENVMEEEEPQCIEVIEPESSIDEIIE